MKRPPLSRLMVLGASLSVMCSSAALGQDVPASAPSTDTTPRTTTTTTTTTTTRKGPSEASVRATQQRAAINAVADGNRLLTEKQLDAALARYMYALANLPEGSSYYVHARIGLSRVKYAQGVRMFEEAKKKNPDGTPTVDHNQRDKMLADAESLLREAVAAEPSQEAYRVAFRNIQHYRNYLAWEVKNVEGVINNPAVTPEFVEQVNTVQRLFEEYKRFMETGQYDEANKALDKIPVIDRWNKTAIEQRIRVEKYRKEALLLGVKVTKERRMHEVTDQWFNRPTPEVDTTTTVIRREIRVSPLARITEKLQTIRIPRVQFDDLDIEEVVRFLGDKSRQYDARSGEGVNFVLKLPTGGRAPLPTAPASGAAPAATGEPAADVAPQPAIVTKVTLDVSDRSLEDILQLISTLTNLQYRIEEYAVVLLPSTDVTDQMVTRSFQVPADFFRTTLVPGSAGPGSTFVKDVQSIVTDVKAELISRGVRFDGGATATFIPGSSKLVVQNTPDQIEITGRLIESATMEVPMVEIETKLAEFTDDSIKELSFNYVLETGEALSPTLNLPIASTVFSQNYQAATANRTGAATPGSLNGAGASPFGGITANSLDSLLLSNTGNVIPPQNFITGTAFIPNTPNTFAVGFRINGRGVQAVMSALDNLKGVDLLAAPKVIAMNRSPAKIEIVREMRYPTEFERPEINSTIFAIDAPVDLLLDPPATQVYLALPATPRTFESRNIGVTLEVTPTTYPDKRIDLDITNVEVVDFEGFINYGQPIVQRQTSDNPLQEAPAVANGVVNQPVFSTRSIRTRLQVLDGESIVMGGLLREETQKIDDRVPLLGDLPLVGRLFQSKVDKTFKRNLMIFLTARLIKSDGKPLNSLAIPVTDETLLLPVSTSAPHTLEPMPFDAKDVEFRPIPLLPVDELPR